MTDSSFASVPNDLNDLERLLLGAACVGELLNVDEVDSSERLIRAKLIRDMLRGRHGPLDPKGLCISGAWIAGPLDLDGVTAAVGLKLVDCSFDSQVSAWNARLPWLDLSESRLPALRAESIVIESGLWMNGAVLAGSNERGSIDVGAARIGGPVDFSGMRVTNGDGPAVRATRLQVNGNVLMRRASLRGGGSWGTIQLFGARIGGILSLSHATIVSLDGKALHAPQLEIDGNLVCRGIEVSGRNFGGVISLLGARVRGDMIFSDADIVNLAGLIIDLEHARVEGKIFLSRSIMCSEPCIDDPCAEPKFVDLNGFAFGALEAVPGQAIPWREWLHIIRHHTQTYRPGPYQALAKVERESGHDGNARRILIAQQKDLQRRDPESLGNWPTRRFHWLWGLLAGYGYLARRTAAALLLALATAGALGAWAGRVTDGGHHVGERVVSFAAADGQPCTTIELIGLGLDRGLPLAPTGVRARCDLNPDTNWAPIFTVSIWILQAAIWGLATLALAGYTGLIRKPG